MKWIIILCILISSFTQAERVSNESELGVTSAQGNSRMQSYNFKQLNSYPWDTNTLRFNARYLNGFANGLENSRYLFSSLRYEREINQLLSWFLAQSFESDRFAGYSERHSSDIGEKFFIYKEEMLRWFVEGGYRYMRESRRNGTDLDSNYLRAYNEVENSWNTHFSTKFWIEYLPNMTTKKDYQINSEISLSALLSNIFSVKTGYLVRYDNLPAPGVNYRTDSIFTTALVAKF